MINLDLGGNGDTHAVTDEVVLEAINSLENPEQKVELSFFGYLHVLIFFLLKGSRFEMSGN